MQQCSSSQKHGFSGIYLPEMCIFLLFRGCRMKKTKLSKFWRNVGDILNIVVISLLFCSAWEFLKFIFVSCILAWFLALMEINDPQLQELAFKYLEVMGVVFIVLMFSSLIFFIKYLSKIHKK